MTMTNKAPLPAAPGSAPARRIDPAHLKAGRAALLMLACLAGCGAGSEAQTDSTAPPASAPGTAPTPAPTPAPTSARWQPSASETWQWQLSGTVNTGYAVTAYDIDLFDTPATTIAQRRAAGKRVVCYFSGGSSENWRPDFARFAPADMGNPLDGWPGERWLDTRSTTVREIMVARMDLAVAKGCDGVEPDNVDGYTNSPGLPLTAATQLDYNRFLAAAAHARGLAIGLKNDIDQLTELEPDFDFAVNEQCFEYNECAAYATFTSRNKPVLNAEYADRFRNNTGGARDGLCASARSAGIRTLVLPLKLDDSFRFACN